MKVMAQASRIGRGPRTSVRGFTIVEVLVVISIMLILITITMPAISRMNQRSRISKTKSIINKIELAMAAYQSFWGFYPPGGSGVNLNSAGATRTLQQFLCTYVSGTGTQGRGAYMPALEPKSNELITSGGKKLFVDAWGRPLIVYSANPAPLEHNRNTADIYSQGPNGATEVDNVDNNADGRIDDEAELTDDITNWNG